MKINYNTYAEKAGRAKLGRRVIDFRWYYGALVDIGCSYRTYAIAFEIAAWVSRTFNVVLLTYCDEPRQKVI